MKKIDWKELKIEPHNIVVAETTNPDYEMSRIILLEFEGGKIVVLRGYHCSCYDFDETEWDAIEHTVDEIRKLADADYNKGDSFWKQVKSQYC